MMNRFTRLRDCDYRCYPLSTFESLINFKLSDIEQQLIDEFCIQKRSKFSLPGPKVILTHDYKGQILIHI